MSGKFEFVRRSRIAAPAAKVFGWHERPGAFERLSPPWENVRVIERSGGIRDGDRITLEMRIGPLRRRWIAEHRDYEEGRTFTDFQVSGPFRSWRHRHTVEPDGADACHLEDRIEYELPGGALGARLGGSFVRRKLEAVFRHRHFVTARDTESAGGGGADVPALRVAVTGSRGMVGSALVPLLSTRGHEVRPMVRVKDGASVPAGCVGWDAVSGRPDMQALEGTDVVIHLAGENIASGRWTALRKQRILDSRVQGTAGLARALAGMERKPKLLVCASAVGFYGDRGEETLTEESAPGSLFLSRVCTEWEAAADPAREAGIRVVHLRFGVILSPTGGALAKMLPPFRVGVGGRIGDGRQYMSWVTLEDAIGATLHAVENNAVKGPVNVVAPDPVTNADFTRALGRVLRRPAIFPVPAVAARLAFGEMGDELLLSSARVTPERLTETRYPFAHASLDDALRAILGR